MSLEIDYEKSLKDDAVEIDEDYRIPISQDLQKPYQVMIRQAKAAATTYRDGAVPAPRLTHDWVVTHELIRRYHNFVMQDCDALDGADVTSVWRYHRDNSNHGNNRRESGLRGVAFVLMDADAIEQLASAPAAENMAAMSHDERVRVAWSHWIKVVSTGGAASGEREELGEAPTEYDSRRRIRLLDLLDVFFYVQHIGGIEELGVKGHNRERFPVYMEWNLCENDEPCVDTWDWLAELYGNR